MNKQIIIDYNEYLEMVEVTSKLFELLQNIEANKNINIEEIKKSIVDILGVKEL